MNTHTLFVNVRDYYADLVNRLYTAKKNISMACLAFEDGFWAHQIVNALVDRSAAGVHVRLMVDQLGQLTDEPRRMPRNFQILKEMRSAGIQVDVFQPRRPGLSLRNRLHSKFCAVDEETAYLGGSNIGDYYTKWSDTNVRVDGLLGDSLHRVYDHLHSFSLKEYNPAQEQDLSDLWAGDDQILLSIPGRQPNIHRALLKLILEARESVHIRTWYFLPDREILEALCLQASKGVQVHIVLSHRTRVRLIDLANYVPTRQLTYAGGNVYRYQGTYMHAKTAWNEQGTCLVGSANVDPHSMGINFEACVQVQDHKLCSKLQQAFLSDLSTCSLQTRESYRRHTFPSRILSHACHLASPLL